MERRAGARREARRRRLKRLREGTAALAAGTLLLALALYAPEAAEGVRAGLRISAETALPALFPFFVAGSLMVRTGLAAAVGRLLARPFHRVYGLPGAGAAALALGLLGGYPVGAQTTAQLFRAGQLDKEEAERLLGFVNCSGPAFLVGMCGAAVCGSVRTGFALYAVHIAAALMTGLALTRAPGKPPGDARPSEGEPFTAAFVGAVTDGMATALKVTAFVVFFAVLLALAGALGALDRLAGLLGPGLRLAGFSAEAAEPFARGLLELTNGIAALPGRGLGARELFPLLSMMVGFGGLSVHCQTLSILSGSGLSTRFYWTGKLLHAALSYALASIWCAVLPQSAAVFAPVGVSGPALAAFPAAAAMIFILFSIRYGKSRGNAV